MTAVLTPIPTSHMTETRTEVSGETRASIAALSETVRRITADVSGPRAPMAAMLRAEDELANLARLALEARRQLSLDRIQREAREAAEVARRALEQR
jgi:hypothetical protein